MRNRKKKNGGNRLENLSALILNDGDISPETGSLFDKDRPLRLEIGCGKGDFIAGISLCEPDYNYIAVERISDVALAAVEKYAEGRGLGTLDHHGGWRGPDGTVYKGERWEIPADQRGNVRFYIGDAARFLEIAPKGRFDRIYANFSDPWPKSRHEIRRLTHPGFLKKYSELLAPGGELRIKTDNDGLFEYTLESLTSSGWSVLFSTHDLHSDDTDRSIRESNVVTEYEKRFTEQGVNIKAVFAAPPVV